LDLWTLFVWSVVVGGLGLGLLLSARRRQRRFFGEVRQARGRVGPEHPVVLLHGLFGFDELEIGGSRHQYFRGLTQQLERLGVDVHRPRLARVAGVETRAQQLVHMIEGLSAKRVNLIAHSMGGLDARYALTHLGLADRVASLITISAPHRGTPLADLGRRLRATPGLASALRQAGIDLQAFQDITTQGTRDFNQDVPDAEDVWYDSVVGRASGPTLNPLLWAPHRYLLMRAGENDGIVPVASQVWGEVVAEVDADHWAQVGWSAHFDAADLFSLLLRELRDRGL
jgi:triacylglycerol lipase